MTTFAEEVYREVFTADWGARRFLNDIVYIQMDIRGGPGRWTPENGDRSMTNVQMYEMTIR